MAVKKKRTAKKKPTKKSWRKSPKQMVDQVLARVNPQLQEKIDQLVTTLEDNRDARLGNLSLLAAKILSRAQSISRSLPHLKSRKRGTSS